MLALCTGIVTLTDASAHAGSWAALSIDNTGASGWSWNRPDENSARTAAQANCKSSGGKVCGNVSVVEGTNWVAGIRCLGRGSQWGLNGVGPTAKLAISNAYKIGIRGGFDKRECKLRGIVTGDGSQMKFKK